MKLWIIHNASINIEKNNILIERFYRELKKRDCEVEVLKNDEIVMYYDNWNSPRISVDREIFIPDGVLFWDKDIMLARHLESLGIRVFNPSFAIEICDNKALTNFNLLNLHIPIPMTFVAPFVYKEHMLADGYLKQVISIIGFPMVVKEVKGSFGMQVYKVDNYEQLINQLSKLADKQILFQEFIQTSMGKDIRVNVVGDKVIGAMLRINTDDFRANITLGATAEPIELTQAQENIALKVHKALHLDFSGIDLLFSDKGEPILCEVNSNPNFLSFENTTGLDCCNAIIDYIFGVLKCKD